MPEGKNSVPLQKQLLQLDLTGGVDERTRAELMASARSCVQMNNLLQEEVGAWTMRPGLTAISTSTEPSGTLVAAQGLVRTRNNGLGLIGSETPNFSGSAVFHQLQSDGKFLRKGTAPEFSVTGHIEVSSQNSLTAPFSCASNTKFDVIIYVSGQDGAGNTDALLSVFDRATNQQVAKYHCKSSFGALNCRCVFVDDRYLHVWAHDTGTGPTKVTIFDTNSAWPSSAPAPVVANAVEGAAALMYDISRGTGQSYCTVKNHVYSCTNVGIVTMGTFVDLAYTCDEDNAGNLWVVGLDNASGFFRVSEFAAANVAAGPGSGAHGKNYVTTVAPFGSTIAKVLAVPAGVSQSTIWLVDVNYRTGASAALSRIYAATTADVDLTTFHDIYGWSACGPLFYSAVNDSLYLQLSKQNDGSAIVVNGLTHNVIVNISGYKSLNYSPTAGPVHVFPVAAGLETWTSVIMAGPVYRYKPISTGKFVVLCDLQISARSFASAFYELQQNDNNMWEAASFGNSTYLSCGCISNYDGQSVYEDGFYDLPWLRVSDSGGAGNPNGSYKYVAVYKHVNAEGEITYSRTSPPQSVSVANHKVTIKVYPCQVTNKIYDGNVRSVITEVYRTVSGGTQYQLVASSQSGPASPTQELALTAAATDLYLTFDDNISDVTLASQPLMFRQPGTFGTGLDRYPLPSGSQHLIPHKDRLFTVDPYGIRVAYSSFFVDGETAWSNPSFSFFVHGGSGPITGLVSMDGRLFIFKRDAIFVVDGDGPPENGGNGTEFSPPQRLATDFGCINQKSITITPDGILFQSTRGIELLSRALQVDWIGAKVQSTVSAYSTCHGTCIDSKGRVYISMSNGVNGKVIVYDTILHCWSTMTFNTGSANAIIEGLCLATIGNSEVVCVTDASARAFYLDSTTGLDNAAEVVGTFETGWIHAGGPQGRQSVRGIYGLLKKRDNHCVNMYIAEDYVDSYIKEETWEPDIINDLVPEELLINTENPQTVALKYKLEIKNPSDLTDYPVTTGKGADLLDVSVHVAVKAGPQKLAQEAKS
jgi:hypothetical protein